MSLDMACFRGLQGISDFRASALGCVGRVGGIRTLEPTMPIENNVRIHISVTPTARRALRLAAAAQGTTVAALVERWAVMEADALGLRDAVRGSGPSSASGSGPSSRS